MSREMIARQVVSLKIERIESVDCADMFIVSIAREHFGREPQKIKSRTTIVFKDDSFRFMAEKPADGFRDARAASEILVAEQRPHLARPVNQLHAFAHKAAALLLSRTIFPRTVHGDIDARRPRRTDGRNLSCHEIGTG